MDGVLRYSKACGVSALISLRLRRREFAQEGCESPSPTKPDGLTVDYARALDWQIGDR
jgi:hypothetical protein